MRFFALLLLAVATGCGTGVYPVDGRVNWTDGAAATELAGAQVVFEQQAANTTARGTILPDGTFHITTNTPDDGAVPGEHKVAIIEVGRKSLDGPDGTNIAPGVINPRFYSIDTSGLTASIKPGTNQITLIAERNKAP